MNGRSVSTGPADAALPRAPRRRRSATLRRGALAAALAAAGACSDVTVEESRPTRVELTATPPSATVGQTVTFHFEAEGSLLTGVEVAFGDGAADTLEAAGAQVAGGSMEHAYGEAGEYEAIATVEEAFGDRSSDTILVPVAAPSGG